MQNINTLISELTNKPRQVNLETKKEQTQTTALSASQILDWAEKNLKILKNEIAFISMSSEILNNTNNFLNSINQLNSKQKSTKQKERDFDSFLDKSAIEIQMKIRGMLAPNPVIPKGKKFDWILNEIWTHSYQLNKKYALIIQEDMNAARKIVLLAKNAKIDRVKTMAEIVNLLYSNLSYAKKKIEDIKKQNEKIQNNANNEIKLYSVAGN